MFLLLLFLGAGLRKPGCGSVHLSDELVFQSALANVETWLDARGIGKSSETVDCTAEVISDLQEGEYHPRLWIELLEAMTQQQLMVLAEEAGWAMKKRKDVRVLLMRSSFLFLWTSQSVSSDLTVGF